MTALEVHPILLRYDILHFDHSGAHYNYSIYYVPSAADNVPNVNTPWPSGFTVPSIPRNVWHTSYGTPEAFPTFYNSTINVGKYPIGVTWPSSRYCIGEFNDTTFSEIDNSELYFQSNYNNYTAYGAVSDYYALLSTTASFAFRGALDTDVTLSVVAQTLSTSSSRGDNNYMSFGGSLSGLQETVSGSSFVNQGVVGTVTNAYNFDVSMYNFVGQIHPLGSKANSDGWVSFDIYTDNSSSLDLDLSSIITKISLVSNSSVAQPPPWQKVDNLQGSLNYSSVNFR